MAPSSPPPAAPDVRWFSPGHQQALLDILDPARELLTLRLYRDHCCPIDASYTKDLSVFAREMPHLVLVDNTPVSFAYQPQNAIPIVTWRHDDGDAALVEQRRHPPRLRTARPICLRGPSEGVRPPPQRASGRPKAAASPPPTSSSPGDCELLRLLPLLDELAKADDVRPVLRRACRVQALTEAWRANNAAVAEAAAAPRPATPGGGGPLSPRRRAAAASNRG